MGIFKGIKEVRPRNNNNWFGQKKEGVYVLRIDECKETQNRQHVPMVVITFTTIGCVEAACDRPHLPSEEVVVVWKVNDFFLEEVKTFVSASMGCEFSDVDEDSCELVFGEKQPLNGRLVQACARSVTTKDGGEFTKVTWDGQPTLATIARLDQSWVEELVDEDVLEELAEDDE